MKILVTRHSDKNPQSQDYLCDQVFHGLNGLGHETTDDFRFWYLYRSEFQPWGGKYNINEGHYHGSLLYGGGFSYAATLDENLNIVRDPEIIQQRIKTHYYDKIIIGRPDYKPKYFNVIFEYYKRQDIITLDGRDEQTIDDFLRDNTIYFKREMFQEPDKFFNPVSFAIPVEKCRVERAEKTQAMGTVVPGRVNTYRYKVEKEYYDDYARSLFAVTHKKRGWDCMRHYEILSNRCIPYFSDIEHAPKNTMTTLNKQLLLEIKREVDKNKVEYYMPGNPGWAQYCVWEDILHKEFITNCITTKLAGYILKNV